MNTSRRIGRSLGVLGALGLMVVLSGAVAFQAAPLAIAYWPLDETAGTIAVDVAGGNNGTLNGGPIPLATPLPPLSTNGPTSHALTFDGTGAQYIQVANTAALQNVQEGSYTLSAWCRPADVPTGTDKDFNTNYAVIIKPGFHEGIKYTKSNSFSFDHWGTGNLYQGTGGGSCPPGFWYHVTAVLDRAVGQLRLYVNGALVSSVPATLETREYDQAPWRIGAALPGTANYAWPMKGDIDDVRIYNYALTGTQIAVLAAGTPTPTGLTATSGLSQVSLTWTAPPQAVPYTYSVYASTTPNPTNWGAPIATGLTATNYVHTTGTPNVRTYYTVTATSIATSGYCPPANGTNYTPITADPPTGLQTNESGAAAVFNLVFNLPLPVGSSVTITLTSTRPTEGKLTTTGVPPTNQIVYGPVNGPVAAGSTIGFMAVGINDDFADGPQPYEITITTASGNALFNHLPIPPIHCVNNDNDTPGLTFSRTAGLQTTESGGTATFTVVLNTQPTSEVTMNLTSSNPLEGTVQPATLKFIPTEGAVYSPASGTGGWNVGHEVTVTGVDDAVLDFTVPYSIVTGVLVSTDPKYNTMAAPDVACVNLDDEVPPELPEVWGSGGCGLLGLEVLFPILALSRLRRRV
jgi:hypothetical protein